ncbi:hypothetical protein BV380_30360, partial [Klebsiella pneumoniae]
MVVVFLWCGFLVVVLVWGVFGGCGGGFWGGVWWLGGFGGVCVWGWGGCVLWVVGGVFVVGVLGGVWVWGRVFLGGGGLAVGVVVVFVVGLVWRRFV